MASGTLCQGQPAPPLSSPSDETLAPDGCENIRRSGLRPHTRPVSSTNGVTVAAHTDHSELMTRVKCTINSAAPSTFKLSPFALGLKRRCPGAAPGSSPWGWDGPFALISCGDLGDGWRAGGCRGREALVSSAWLAGTGSGLRFADTDIGSTKIRSPGSSAGPPAPGTRTLCCPRAPSWSSQPPGRGRAGQGLRLLRGAAEQQRGCP